MQYCMKVSLSKIEKHLEKPDNMKQFFESAIKTADLGSFIHTFFRGYKLPHGVSFVAT